MINVKAELTDPISELEEQLYAHVKRARYDPHPDDEFDVMLKWSCWKRLEELLGLRPPSNPPQAGEREDDICPRCGSEQEALTCSYCRPDETAPAPSEQELVERLRKGRSANEWVSEELAHEAADRIEWLKVEAQCDKEYMDNMRAALTAQKAEIERLHDQLSTARELKDGYHADLALLRAQHDRLREALQAARVVVEAEGANATLCIIDSALTTTGEK